MNFIRLGKRKEAVPGEFCPTEMSGCCRGNCFKPKEEEFRLVRRKLFTVRVVKHSNSLPKRGGGCPIPGGIKDQVGWGSGELLDVKF